MLTEKDYCDYETCVALKELGYVGSRQECECFGAYFNFGKDMFTDSLDNTEVGTNEFLRVPLYLAQKWLREEKGLHIEVFFSLMDDKRQLHYDWHIVHNIRFDNDEYTYDCDVLDSMGSYKSYEEALSEGVRASIKILQDEQKENN